MNILKETHEYSKDVVPGKTPLKSLSFRLHRDPIALFSYQQERVRAGSLGKESGDDHTLHGHNGHSNGFLNRLFDGKSPSAMSDGGSPQSLFAGINLSNRFNAPTFMRNDEELFRRLLDENAAKLEAVCCKIVNELSDKVCFERLVYPGTVSKVRWDGINRLKTLRNLHIVVKEGDVVHRGLDDFATHCGHTLTNLKLTVRDLSKQQDHEDVLHHLNRNLKECTKLRHVRLLIGEVVDHSVGDSLGMKKENGRSSTVSNKPRVDSTEVGRVSMDSLCRFMQQHSKTLSSLELHTFYLSFDLDEMKREQSDRNGIDSKFYIPDVKQALKDRLEDLFFSCSHLKRIKIQHVTSHRKYVTIQRLFHGKPHTVGVENFDHFVENQFL